MQSMIYYEFTTILSGNFDYKREFNIGFIHSNCIFLMSVRKTKLTTYKIWYTFKIWKEIIKNRILSTYKIWYTLKYGKKLLKIEYYLPIKYIDSKTN